MAFLGITGCGLEQHLLSLSRALGADGFDPPGENQGFLRPDAYLGIVIIANEDDCSARDGANSALFGTAPNTLAGTFGPVQSFRCNEFGHTCGRGAPNRNAPNNMATDMVTYTDCVSNETSAVPQAGRAFVTEIKSLKADPANQILVAAIVGVPPNNPNGDIPYVVRWAPAPVPDTGPWPIITPGLRHERHGRAVRRSAGPHQAVREGVRRERVALLDLPEPTTALRWRISPRS